MSIKRDASELKVHTRNSAWLTCWALLGDPTHLIKSETPWFGFGFEIGSNIDLTWFNLNPTYLRRVYILFPYNCLLSHIIFLSTMLGAKRIWKRVWCLETLNSNYKLLEATTSKMLRGHQMRCNSIYKEYEHMYLNRILISAEYFNVVGEFQLFSTIHSIAHVCALKNEHKAGQVTKFFFLFWQLWYSWYLSNETNLRE